MATFAELRNLPQEVRDWLYSPGRDAWYADAYRRWGISGERRDVIEGIILDIFLKKATIEQFRARLISVLGSDERGNETAIEILGEDFSRIAEHLGIVTDTYITSLGGNPMRYRREVTTDEVIADVMSMVGLGGVAPSERKRLHQAMETFLTEARTKEQVHGVLTRATKVGGVGLSEEQASQLLHAGEQTFESLRARGVNIVHTSASTGDSVAQRSLVRPSAYTLIQPEDDIEIARQREAAATDSGAMSTAIMAGVDRVIQRTGAKFRREEVERRFRTAIEARLRDVRTDAETIAVLTRTAEHGGLGIPEPQARKLLEIIRVEVEAFHGHVAEAQKRVADQVHAKRPSTITGPPTSALPAPVVMPSVSPAPTTPAITPKPTSSKPQAPAAAEVSQLKPLSALRPASDSPVADLKPTPPPPPPIVPTTKLETKKSSRVILNSAKNLPHSTGGGASVADSLSMTPNTLLATLLSATPVSPPLPPPALPLAKQLPSESKRLPADRLSEPLPAPLQRSESSRPVLPKPAPSMRVPSPSPSKPRIDDIRAAIPRLVGPIDELRQLTLSDFRKIGATPTDAAARIVGKIDLLMRDSYTKRTEGIRAIRMSPLMGNYTAIVNTALTMKRKIDHVIAEELDRDRRGMTAAEHAALGMLNQKLRV